MLRIVTVALTTLMVHVALASSVPAGVPQDRLDKLDAYLLSESRRFNLPAVAVAVTSEGEIVHQAVLGKRVRNDSAFLIGSCSKTITALAALIALDEAGVDIDSTVQSVLPRLTICPAGEPLRIVHLLQHRSGLSRRQGFDVLPSLDELAENGHAIQLHHSPGEHFDYCNLNYALLALVVEQVSGDRFGDFVRSRIFDPVGMTSSSCSLRATDAAPEYQYCFGLALQVDHTDAPGYRVPSGFIRCSARDLAKIQILLLQDGVLDGKQVVPRKIIRRMKTPPGETGVGYAMGLYRGNHDCGPIIAHEGATPTAYAFHGALTDNRLGIVLLININLFDPMTDHGESIYDNIFRILEGETPQATYPIRIWVRWFLFAATLLTLWQLSLFVVRWRQTGWRYRFPESSRDRIAIALQAVIPLAVCYAILRWTGMPLLQMFLLEPDVMWSVTFLTVSGIATGWLKRCTGAESVAVGEHGNHARA